MKVFYEINVEKNGIEISFDKVPPVSIRDELKANGFRWHSVKKVWYAKQAADRLKMVQKLAELRVADENTAEKKKKTKTNVFGIQVGDLFEMSWGYEQTNVDFFQVIELVGEKSVRIREVKPIVVNSTVHGMSADTVYKVTNEMLEPTDYSVHIRDQVKGDLKRICGSAEYPYINMSSYANAYKYNGQELYESWYA